MNKILQSSLYKWMILFLVCFLRHGIVGLRSMFKFLIDTIKLLFGKVVPTFPETHNASECLPMSLFPGQHQMFMVCLGSQFKKKKKLLI